MTSADGEAMPFPTKNQQGAIVPAISGGPGEYVHKLRLQLPPEEWVGQPRALILEGEVTYKIFGTHGPQSLILSQKLRGAPGSRITVTVPVLGATFDATPLEDDHFIASVSLGNTVDKRTYSQMVERREIPGNERDWNLFVVSDTFPASGKLTLTLVFQQNWPGRVEFFIDGLTMAVQ